MTLHLRSFAGGLAVTVLLLLCPPADGQDDDLRQFDPSDVYFQAWLQVREAEQSIKDEKFLDAYNTYNKAAKLFDTVALYHPEWKPHLVKDRQDSTRDSMGEIREQALAQQRDAEEKFEGLVEGPGTAMKLEEPGIKPLSPAKRQQVSALQQQIAALQLQLRDAVNDRNANAAQLRRALTELEAERNRLARAPLQGQVRELTDQINKVKRERDAMGAALQQSRGEYQKAHAQAAAMQAERDNAVQLAAELEGKLQVQSKAANDVVRSLRKQLVDLRETLKIKDELLETANQRADALQRQLRESHAEIADLREERDALLQERDHMAALLALNETDRVKALIKQNMELGKELNEARDNLSKVVEDNNHTATQLNDATRDMVVAKARIIQLNRENSQQRKRLDQLETKLRAAGSELAAGSRIPDNVANREEVAMLQGIIDRQLKLQKRRAHAKELLFEQVKRLGIEDNEFTGAMEMFAGQELELTPEEKLVMENQIVDGEFVFADRPNAREREAAEGELQRSIRVKTDLAQRAFSNGRFLVAREFFESVLEEHPGHVPSMLNLGVVQLRNNDPLMAIQAFNDAIAIRGDIPYAQFMLGVAYYQLTEYVRARECLQRALDGNPGNAVAYAYLGSIAAVSGELATAEKNFNEAIRMDPTLTEPFYNLAILRAREGKKEEARKLYDKALENGAQPDLDFQQSIAVE